MAIKVFRGKKFGLVLNTTKNSSTFTQGIQYKEESVIPSFFIMRSEMLELPAPEILLPYDECHNTDRYTENS